MTPLKKGFKCDKVNFLYSFSHPVLKNKVMKDESILFLTLLKVQQAKKKGQ